MKTTTKAPTATQPLDGGPPLRGQLVGRAAETARIGAALAAARSQRGAAVVITGEPGVGKSRLAAEVLAAAERSGMATAGGRAGTVGPAVPYRPLVEGLLCLTRAGALPAPGATNAYGPHLTALLEGTPHPASGPLSPLLVAESVLRALAVAGRRRGCLLVVDDLQDADAATLAAVEYLLDNIGRQPAVLLLVTGREPGAAADLVARARQRGAAAVVEVPPLGPDAVRRLLAAELALASEEIGPGLLDRAMTGSAGIPFVLREIAHGLAGAGDGMPPVLPAALADSVARRTARLGPGGARLLGTAAVFGPRFPLAVVQRASGCGDDALAMALRTATAAGLVVPDTTSAGWWAFRHPLVGPAVLAGLGPGERAGAARRAAGALAALHPGLPGPWCARAAALHGQAGETGEAVRLYCEAAGRAAADGAVDRALELLARAHRLTGPATEPGTRATVLERLLDTAVSGGRPGAVPTGADGLTGDPGLPPARRAGLHARLAETAALAGRPAEAVRHIDVARLLLGDRPDDAHRAVVDVAAAHVELHRLTPDRLTAAAALARRGADAAERAGLPERAGRALLLLGQLAAEQDEAAAAALVLRACALAHAGGLPALRAAADLRLAGLAAARDGRPGPVDEARDDARRTGVLPPALDASFFLALDQVRRGEFTAAAERLREAAADAERLGLGACLARLRLAEAVRYAHQGRRAEMEEALEGLGPLVDAAPGVRAMSYGLARAFCSLLEDEHDAAEREFAQALAYDTENPATCDIGRHGIVLLLGVVAGRMGRRHHADVARAGAGGTRWNRQFVALADAVLLGREGRPVEASAAAGAALAAAEPYPMARNLCVRLVAAAAHRDGWGAPVDWLREAEEYFHTAGLRNVSGACRALLRRMGAPVRQRRSGDAEVPLDLRRCGITVREFEVARLVAERIGNKDIAGRLHISHRTVEKHVASLLQKTGHPNRAAFASAARADLVT